LTLLSFLGLQGGGLYISGTATLTNTNVYSNEAVCSLFEPSVTFHPSPNGMLTVGGVSWQGNVSFALN